MRIGLVGWVLVASCIGTLIILAFLAISTNRGFEENDRLRHLVTDSYDARSALQELMTLHQDIEIGQRGYAITGVPRSSNHIALPKRKSKVSVKKKMKKSYDS